MYTEAQLNALLAQVEAEFAPFLNKTEADVLLAKAEDDGDKKPEPKDDKPKDEGEAPEAPKEGEGKEDGEGPPAAKEDAPPAEGAPAPAEGEAPPAAAADDAACPPGDPGCDYDDEDHAHMAEMYGSMSPAELKAHHDAVRKALDAQGGMAAAAAPAPEAPPADAGAVPPPAAPMDKCGEMMKSEGSIEVPAEAMVPAKDAEMLKSELAARTNELEELKKSADVMKAFITKLFDKKKAPAGKAITDLGVLEKSEGTNVEKNFSKGEITKILTAKTNNPTLAKSDRDAITAYYTGGQVNLDSIRHLLK